MANTWRIFHKSIPLSNKYVTDITKAICILHNFVRDDASNCDVTLQDDAYSLPDIKNVGTFSSAIAYKKRDLYKTYFNGLGAVE